MRLADASLFFVGENEGGGSNFFNCAEGERREIGKYLLIARRERKRERAVK